MGIRLIHKAAEGSMDSAGFQDLLDRLSAMYSGNVEFRHDPVQNSVAVMKGGRVLGSVSTEGALHTVVWAVLSLAEREA